MNKEEITSELHRIAMTFKDLQMEITKISKLIWDKSIEIEKLIKSILLPTVENENHDLSFNAETPKLMCKSSAELEKYSRTQPVLRENRSFSIPLTNSNFYSKINIPGTAMEKVSTKKQHIPSVMLSERGNLKENSINLDKTHIKREQDIYYSLDKCFKEKQETRKETRHQNHTY